jgi:spore coat polysaccharide biosynthesis predicted glycosyltransferase SpsG/CMP-N-acetylneuraminic acid synthetase
LYIQEYVEKLYDQIFFIERNRDLSKDAIPLDPVIYDATLKLEKKLGKKYQFVITMLPTTPLLSSDTILDAIKSFTEKYDKIKSLILTNEHRHIFWKFNEKKKEFYLLTERKNRQYLKPIYEETGGVVITKRDYLIQSKNRVCNNPELFVCPPDESVDINNWHDLILTEKLLNRKKIGFKVSGNFKTGLGHVYRCINLALRLIDHEIYFFVDEKGDKEAIDTIDEFFFKTVTYKNNDDLIKKIEKLQIDAIINDTRGIDPDFVLKLRKKKSEVKVISINESAQHSKLCDLIINPEFEFTGPPDQLEEESLFGYKYNVIREDVLMFPIKKYNKNINRILLTFGGSDPEGVTIKILSYIKDIDGLKNKEISVILGEHFSRDDKKKIKSLSNKLNSKGFQIKLINNVKFMGYHLFNSDLVITSNSTTVYDIIALGGFTIAVSKVKEELTHLFSRLSGAVFYLGYHGELDYKKFKSKIEEIIKSESLRKSRYDLLVKYAEEIRKGQKTVEDMINSIVKGDNSG